MKSKEIGGMACLILTAMIWGFAFVSQVQGMASMTPPVLQRHAIHAGGPFVAAVVMVQTARQGHGRISNGI